MTTLAQYERARAALAEATRVDQVLPILDEVEHVKLYARQISDQKLLAEASEFQMRAERRLGFVISEAKKAGHFAQHRPKKAGTKENGNSDEPLSATLEDVGVSKRLSSTAQRRSSISEQAFEQTITAMRDRIASGRAKIIEAPLPGGGLSIGHDRKEVAESLDYSPTPPWGTRCLPEIVLPQISVRQLGTVWEPACGEGHMAEVLREFSGDVTASDIHEYGYNDHLIDFLSCEHFNRQRDPDWIITNPPFNKAEEFALHALKLARVGVALFVRWQWIEGVNRFNDLFGPYPPAIVAVFSERIPLHMGRWEPAGATMTAYCWVVWLKNHTGDTRLFWIPPGQRKALTKDDDAERFTAHPVIRKQHVLCDEPFDTTTGEILDPPAAGDLNPASTPEPVPDTVSSAVPESGAGSLSCEDDGLDIPPFLRRPPPPVQSETSHDKAR